MREEGRVSGGGGEECEGGREGGRKGEWRRRGERNVRVGGREEGRVSGGGRRE